MKNNHLKIKIPNLQQICTNNVIGLGFYWHVLMFNFQVLLIQHVLVEIVQGNSFENLLYFKKSNVNGYITKPFETNN
jgi:hypothetical protein